MNSIRILVVIANVAGSLELQEDLLSLLLTEDGMKNIVHKLKSDDDMVWYTLLCRALMPLSSTGR